MQRKYNVERTKIIHAFIKQEYLKNIKDNFVNDIQKLANVYVGQCLDISVNVHIIDQTWQDNINENITSEIFSMISM